MSQALTSSRSNAALTALPTEHGVRTIVVVQDASLTAHRLLIQADTAAAGPRLLASREQQSKAADRIIGQTVAQIALLAVVPAYINWIFFVGVMAAGTIRLGRIYQKELNFAEARRLALEVLRTGGPMFLATILGGQVLTILLQTSVIAYPVSLAIEGVVFSALAYATLIATKAKLSGASLQEVGAMLRETYRQRFRTLKSSAKPEQTAAAPLDYDTMARLAASPVTQRVLATVLEQHGEENKVLTGYLRENNLAGYEKLSADDWKALDLKEMVAQRIWSEVCDRVDVDSLAEVAGNDTVDMTSVEALNKLCRESKDILPVQLSEAAQFAFPLGQPQPLAVYTSHPYLSTTFYPVSMFHDAVFNHKILEARRLLTALGAVCIEEDRSDVFSRKGGAALAAGVDGQVEAKVSGGASRSEISQTGSRLVLRNTGQWYVPDDLVWCPHEPRWQEVIERRREGRLKEYELTVAYEQDLGLNADLRAKLAGMGFIGVGGNFDQHASFIHKLNVKFGEGTTPAPAPSSNKTRAGARDPQQRAALLSHSRTAHQAHASATAGSKRPGRLCCGASRRTVA